MMVSDIHSLAITARMAAIVVVARCRSQLHAMFRLI
jgi:hypothetical protein